jgi:hypothetical protein
MSGAHSALSWVNMLKRNDHSFRDRLSVTEEESQTPHWSPIS